MPLETVNRAGRGSTSVGINAGVTMGRNTRLTAILLGGFVAGTIDIGSACLINGLGVVVILHAIASGLIGKASFTGGTSTAILGLLLQWAMALVIAVIYVAATSVRPAMRRRWIQTGAIAGVVIFLVMNYVVVPLSAAPFKPKLSLAGFIASFRPDKFVADLVAMILFGLIIAFFARDLSGQLEG